MMPPVTNVSQSHLTSQTQAMYMASTVIEGKLKLQVPKLVVSSPGQDDGGGLEAARAETLFDQQLMDHRTETSTPIVL